MKKLILFLLFICITSLLFSQSFHENKDGEECTLEMKNFQVDPGISYSFDVYITRNTSNWAKLGHLVFMTEIYYSSLVLNYNSTALANPTISNLSTIATDTIVGNSIVDVLSIDLVDGGITVPTSETLLLTLSFDVVAPDATAQLDWRLADTAIIDESSNNYHYADGTLELLGSDNSSLPVEHEIELGKLSFVHTIPNPFGALSPHTSLIIISPQTGNLSLNVFNIKGQLVNTLYNNVVQKNQDIQLSWNGKDSNGNDLSSGIYLYQLLIENKLFEIKKVVIIR